MLFVALIAIALAVPIHQAVADEARGLMAGDLLRMESVRGIARDPSTSKTAKATLTLTLSVNSINNARVEFTVASGQISIGDSVYTITSGAGHAIARKFGWIMLHGKAMLPNGSVFEFRLEGILHLERVGLAVAGLMGGIGDESGHSRVRLVVRLSRV